MPIASQEHPMSNILRTLHSAIRWSMLASIALISSIASATDLSNNLSNVTTGVENAMGARVVTAAFKTDASTHVLSTVTLLLANTAAGSAQVSIYSNGNLEPGALIATLISPANYSATLSATTFSASNVNLAANTTYWIV